MTDGGLRIEKLKAACARLEAAIKRRDKRIESLTAENAALAALARMERQHRGHCHAANADRERCPLPVGHPGKHRASATVPWTDDEPGATPCPWADLVALRVSLEADQG